MRNNRIACSITFCNGACLGINKKNRLADKELYLFLLMGPVGGTSAAGHFTGNCRPTPISAARHLTGNCRPVVCMCVCVCVCVCVCAVGPVAERYEPVHIFGTKTLSMYLCTSCTVCSAVYTYI